MNSFKIFTILLLTLILSSCNKTEKATGIGDAIVVTRQIGNQTVYGVSLYAYTFSTFKSVNVVNNADPGKLYTLKANQGFATNFIYEPLDSEYTTSKPAAATYNFSATFTNGATDEFQDEISNQVLNLPNLTKCEYNSTDHQLEVNWDLLTNADSYVVSVMEGNTLVFGSTELASNIKAYAVRADGGGWANGFVPVNGKTYTVRLMAFLYEAGVDAYNVQASSVIERNIVWGH